MTIQHQVYKKLTAGAILLLLISLPVKAQEVEKALKKHQVGVGAALTAGDDMMDPNSLYKFYYSYRLNNSFRIKAEFWDYSGYFKSTGITEIGESVNIKNLNCILQLNTIEGKYFEFLIGIGPAYSINKKADFTSYYGGEHIIKWQKPNEYKWGAVLDLNANINLTQHLQFNIATGVFANKFRPIFNIGGGLAYRF